VLVLIVVVLIVEDQRVVLRGHDIVCGILVVLFRLFVSLDRIALKVDLLSSRQRRAHRTPARCLSREAVGAVVVQPVLVGYPARVLGDVLVVVFFGIWSGLGGDFRLGFR
jgi:hypothetical protein